MAWFCRELECGSMSTIICHEKYAALYIRMTLTSHVMTSSFIWFIALHSNYTFWSLGSEGLLKAFIFKDWLNFDNSWGYTTFEKDTQNFSISIIWFYAPTCPMSISLITPYASKITQATKIGLENRFQVDFQCMVPNQFFLPKAWFPSSNNLW